MNYIYDILVNFNQTLYDFYEWEENEVMHIRKIPILKVSTNLLMELTRFKVCVSKDFLNRIFKKTEIFTNKGVKQIEYACLFSDGESILGIKFSKDGTSFEKTKLLIEEEEEVLDVVLRMKEEIITYHTLNEEKRSFQTRKEENRNIYLKNELNFLKKENDLEKLNYLYYECFGKKGIKKEVMLKELEQSLNDSKSEIMKKMEEFFKLTSK